MKIKHCIYTLLLAVLPFYATAQTFAVLPEIEGMSKGTLPNGTSYFVFQNNSSSGIADFALVQKVGFSSESESQSGMVKTAAKQSLAWSNRLQDRSPQEILLSYGAIPKDYGFVKVDSSSTVYWFDDIPVNARPEILDSTLLVIFDIIDRLSSSEDDFISQRYSPANQAVVISGDIDAKSVISKMQMLSMMTSSSPLDSSALSLPCDSLGVQEHQLVLFEPTSSTDSLVNLSFEYSMDRVPKEYMHTVFPAITSKYVKKMGIVARRRVRKIMEYSAIPFASLETDYLSSCFQGEREKFSLSIQVNESDLLKTVELVGASFSPMSRGWISMQEEKYASGVFFEKMYNWAINPIVLNSTNVDRAISSFLYGAPLSSPRKEMDYLSGRIIADTLECKLLNNFSSAIIHRSENLCIKTNSKAYNEHEIDAAFGRGWYSDGQWPEDIWTISSSSPEINRPQEKVKLRHRRVEPVTGGDMWTFSNGIKVIYKQMPIGDRLHASLAINRGYSTMDGIVNGEGALMNNIIGLYNIDGQAYEDFRDGLYSRKIALHFDMDHSSTCIDMNAPVDSLEAVLGVIKAMAYSRELSPSSVKVASMAEAMHNWSARGGFEEKAALIDSIMCPSNPYSPYRKGLSYTDDFLKRADDFLEDTFDNLSDGMFIFISSVAPDEFKKKLTPLLSGFKTGKRNIRFSQPNIQPAAGSSTYTVEGDEYSGTIAISAKLPLTSENYVLAQLASLVLQERLLSSLVVKGVNADVSTSFRKFPQERFNLFICLEPVDEGGFVDGTVSRNPLEVLNLARSALYEVPTKEEIEKYLPLSKLMLKSRHEHMKTYPSFYIATIKTRYLEGKDLYSKYEAYVDSADAQKVMDTCKIICAGTSLEYMVYD